MGGIETLKPCPLCGKEAAYQSDCDVVLVRCSGDDCLISTLWFDEPEDAAEAWNRRPIEDALRAEIDALLFEWNLMVKTIGAKTHGTAIGEAGQIVRERDALRAELAQLKESLILSHPAQTEEEYAAEMARLNCPLCGGSGHVDDADQAMVAKIAALEAKVQRLEEERNQWKSCVPSHCPITGLPHHGNFKMHETGEYKAFYGGPIISYGLPYKDSDNYLSRERLDEDDMSSEDETMCLLIMEEEELGAMQERIARLEAVRVAAEEFLSAPVDTVSVLELRDALQAAFSDEPAISYGVAVNETGPDEQQAAGEAES